MYDKISEFLKVNIVYFFNWFKGFLMFVIFFLFDLWRLVSDNKNICILYIY